MKFIDYNKKNTFTRIENAYIKSCQKIETMNGYAITPDAVVKPLYNYTFSKPYGTNKSHFDSVNDPSDPFEYYKNFNEPTNIPYKISNYKEYLYSQPPNTKIDYIPSKPVLNNKNKPITIKSNILKTIPIIRPQVKCFYN